MGCCKNECRCCEINTVYQAVNKPTSRLVKQRDHIWHFSQCNIAFHKIPLSCRRNIYAGKCSVEFSCLSSALVTHLWDVWLGRGGVVGGRTPMENIFDEDGYESYTDFNSQPGGLQHSTLAIAPSERPHMGSM